jgi:dienelactone hydrolase
MKSISFAADVPKYEVRQSSANILSEGTRMHADLYAPVPKNNEVSFPLIVMAHGWGGTADMLKSTALDFSKSGFYVIAFDYRGWGKSDGKLIPTKPLPMFKKDLKYSQEIRELREYVDPLDQAQEYINVINWAWNEPLVNTNKIGLWGTSFSGGTVIHVASRDSRVIATVSQAPSMGWGRYSSMNHKNWFAKGSLRSRGLLEYPQPGIKEIGELKGGIIFEKLALFNPINDIKNLAFCSVMFITVQNEELFKNSDHAGLAFETYTGNKKIVEIPKAAHYDIYSGPAKDTAIKLAIDWFTETLKN